MKGRRLALDVAIGACVLYLPLRDAEAPCGGPHSLFRPLFRFQGAPCSPDGEPLDPVRAADQRPAVVVPMVLGGAAERPSEAKSKPTGVLRECQPRRAQGPLGPSSPDG